MADPIAQTGDWVRVNAPRFRTHGYTGRVRLVSPDGAYYSVDIGVEGGWLYLHRYEVERVQRWVTPDRLRTKKGDQ
jgi:hypothetical protein